MSEESAQRRVRVKVRTGTRAALLARVAEFEERYGVPSSRMREAFEVDGELQECAQLRTWSRLWRSAQAIERA